MKGPQNAEGAMWHPKYNVGVQMTPKTPREYTVQVSATTVNDKNISTPGKYARKYILSGVESEFNGV